jgi:hypothetical protein
MNEYLRKDANVEPQKTKLSDLELSEEQSQRPTANVPDSRNIPPLERAETRPVIAGGSADPQDDATGVGTATAAMSGAATGTAATRAPEEEKVALFAPDESKELRARWDSIQVGFVDEPRRAVQKADALVSDTIKRLSEVFANERQTLEHQWDRNEDISTEDFRQALRRYRSFFGRLLNI